MIISQYDDLQTYPEVLILDSMSFYKESVIGNYYIPRSVFLLLQEVSHIFTCLELVYAKKSPIVKLFHKSPNIGEMGQVVELPYKQWAKFLREKTSPLFYLDNCSAPEIMQHVPHDYRFPFPSMSFQIYQDVGKFQAKFLPIDEQKSIDVRSAYAKKMFSSEHGSRFLDKFNL